MNKQLNSIVKVASTAKEMSKVSEAKPTPLYGGVKTLVRNKFKNPDTAKLFFKNPMAAAFHKAAFDK